MKKLKSDVSPVVSIALGSILILLTLLTLGLRLGSDWYAKKSTAGRFIQGYLLPPTYLFMGGMFIRSGLRQRRKT